MQRVRVELVDDLDGSTAEETVPFSLDGVNYEIDLSADNADKLREVLGTYIEKGRRTGGKRGRRSAESSSGKTSKDTTGVDAAEIRAWAAKNGVEVKPQGRIPRAIQEQYAAATA